MHARICPCLLLGGAELHRHDLLLLGRQLAQHVGLHAAQQVGAQQGVQAGHLLPVRQVVKLTLERLCSGRTGRVTEGLVEYLLRSGEGDPGTQGVGGAMARGGRPGRCESHCLCPATALTQAVKALGLQKVQQHEELCQVVLQGGARQQRAVLAPQALQRLEQPRLQAGQGGEGRVCSAGHDCARRAGAGQASS